MSDVVVKRNSTATLGTVDGDLRVGANATLVAEDGKKITVGGAAHFESAVTIQSSFECRSMKVEGSGFGPGREVKVRGDLSVHGDADVVAHLEVGGEVTAENLDVGGHLKSGSATAKRVRVGGHMKTNGKLEAETVDVGGHFTVTDSVRLGRLDVGGHATVGGGTISGGVKVMGHFESTKRLSYGELQVLGHIHLPSGSSGERISIHGNVKFAGDTSCKDMKITGVAKVAGNCSAENIEVLGKFDVSGSLDVSKMLRVFGTMDVKQQLRCEALSLGGKLAAKQVIVDGTAELAGDLTTANGLKARSVVVGGGSRVTGPLVGEEVSVGKKVDLDVGPWGYLWSGKWLYAGRMTKVEDVYGKSVLIEPYSQARRVFAETVQMDEGSIADEVTYVSDLKIPSHYRLNRPAKKTAKLPDPPL
jgi:cytoskeletal protein CcmA (bactofilin family)